MRLAIAGATGMVGARLAVRAVAEGRDVVELTRSAGVDLVGGADVAGHLAGVDTVVDVTNAPAAEGPVAVDFFTTVGRRLGEAATEAGVRRTVLLSIINLEAAPVGHYAAKLAHEQATRAHAPGLVILRAAQFHEFAGQCVAWGRDGDTTAVPDMPVQPVALDTVVRTLLDLAVGQDVPARVDLAGPRPERLVDLAERVVERHGLGLTVKPAPAGNELEQGAMLAGVDATLAGPDFETWLAAGETSRDR